MTKIKNLADRVIFDGHAETREECETITLLCDSLTNSPNFKTICYESGYAEFEKVGKLVDSELKFAAALLTPTIEWDSNIAEVVYRDADGDEISFINGMSPTETVYCRDGEDYTFEVILNNGYVLDTVTLSSDDTGDGVLKSHTDTSFVITAGFNGISQMITLTSKSKQSVTKKSVDLTTLGGWPNLSDGTHTITIVAKGTGYNDSEKSAGVEVVKGL